VNWTIPNLLKVDGKDLLFSGYEARMPAIFDFLLFVGLTGEKNIYKRRGDIEPEVGAPQTKPKRVRLVVDVSGSMYR